MLTSYKPFGMFLLGSCLLSSVAVILLYTMLRYGKHALVLLFVYHCDRDWLRH